MKESRLTLQFCRFNSLNSHSAASLDDAGKSVIQLKRCEFVGNHSQRGGTVHVGVGSQFDINQCLFTNNTTTNPSEGYQWGGAVFVGTGA